ncbi:CHAT domain-containing protein [Flexithrix dorotheae]|uniref:CHAT domain-containing protein n=1 Tax=Flexithrix dorotheae TaxID=70993 RepID=UPI0003A3C936|nr:CHAT domain-containing tetratricopeptide repeat protein [Flexithrix dorotheae]
MSIPLKLVAAFFLLIYSPLSKASVGSITFDFEESDKSAEERTITQPYEFAHPYLAMGDSLNKIKDYEGSIKAYRKAEKLFRKEKNWEGEINAIFEIGICYFEDRKFEEAIEIFEEGESICKEKLPNHSGLLSALIFFKGSCYRYMKEGDLALEELQKCLAIRLDAYGKWNSATARTYIEIGNVYQFVLGNFYKAEQNHKTALDILETKGLEPKASLKFRLFFNLSNSTKGKHDNHKALIYAQKALNLLESGEYNNEAYKKYCYHLIAQCYSNLNDFDNSKLFFEKAITTHQVQDIKNDFLLATYFNGLGQLFKKSKKHKIGLKYFHKARYILEKINKKELYVKKELGNIYQNLGNTFLYGSDKNDPIERVLKKDSSLFYIKKTIRLREDYFSNENNFGSSSYFLLGDYFYNWDVLDSAFHYTNYALSFFIKDKEKQENENLYIEDLDISVLSLTVLRNLLRTSFWIYKEDPHNSLDYLHNSYRLVKIADQMLTELSGNLQREDDQLALNEENKQVYEYGLAGLWELQKLYPKEHKYKKEFVEMMAKSKAKLLSKAFAKAESINQLGLPTDLTEKEKNLEYEISYYHDLLKKITEKSKKAAIYDSLFQLDKAKESLLSQFQKHYPHYYQVKYQDRKVSIEELQMFAVQNNALIIEYFWGRDYNYGMGISASGVEIFKIDSKVEFNVLVYLSSLANGLNGTNAQKTYETFTSNSSALYESLVAPAFGKDKIDKLIIIPDGVLAYIPFESLISKKPQSRILDYKNLKYLINEYTTSYVYSSDFLLKSTTKPGGAPEVLAFSFTDPKELTGNTEPAAYRRNLGMLLGAPMEIMAISKMFEGNYFMGENATEKNFKQKAKEFDIIHLAIHGFAERGNNGEAYLVFRDSLDGEEDGVLYDYELYNLNLNASLTFLSACESGVGKVQKGEGVLSMGRGFAYAGCPSIIMSLWQVHDKFALEIVDEFYKNINEQKLVNESLRNAKLRYLEKADERTAHPAYWAPLVFVGKQDLKYGNNFKNIYFSIGILGMAIIVGFLFQKKSKSKKKQP